VKLASVSGLGATKKAELVLFDTSSKGFVSKVFEGEDYEIASVIGNITSMEDDVYTHLHATLGDKKMNSFAGHLKSAIISATGSLLYTVLRVRLIGK